jgi:predicted phosphohydrolase
MPRQIFALADLHLSFGADRPMDIFGARWTDHARKIAAAWCEKIADDDVMLIAGDVSWALRLRDAAADFDFLRALPGHQILIRGNHDYWWDSLKKNHAAAGDKFYFLQNNAAVFGDVALAGSRLWNYPFVQWNLPELAAATNRGGAAKNARREDDEKIRDREWERLRSSLAAMLHSAAVKIALTHFPPVSAAPESNAITRLLAEYGVDICVYGHVHGLPALAPVAAANCEIDGIRFYLTSADYLDFSPCKIYPAQSGIR